MVQGQTSLMPSKMGPLGRKDARFVAGGTRAPDSLTNRGIPAPITSAASENRASFAALAEIP